MTRLREVREAAFMSQLDLARASGIARPTISRLEAGLQAAQLRTIRKLAAALQVNPAALIKPSA